MTWRSARTGLVPCTLAVLGACLLASPSFARAEEPPSIHKIQHVVMIMQENRSFDSYFGTFPGANGIPAGTCVPDPVHGGCVQPFYSSFDGGEGGPHGTEAAIADIDGGRMDGFVQQAEEKDSCTATGGCGKCRQKSEAECAKEVMGYHDARDHRELLDLRQRLRSSGRHVRVGGVLEPDRAPRDGLGLVGDVQSTRNRKTRSTARAA